MTDLICLPSPALASQRPFPDQASALTQEVCAVSRLQSRGSAGIEGPRLGEILAAKREPHESESDERHVDQLEHARLTCRAERFTRVAQCVARDSDIIRPARHAGAGLEIVWDTCRDLEKCGARFMRHPAWVATLRGVAGASKLY